MHCCICGDTKGTAYCKVCRHNFCSAHRSWLSIEGIWQRGSAAVKQFIGDHTGTPFCRGHYPDEGTHD